MELQIQRIERQKRDPQRYSLFSDNGFLFSISEEILVKYKLSAGMTLTDEQQATVRDDDARFVAYGYAMGYIAVRPRSMKEIQQHLAKKECPTTIIAEVIERLRQDRQIDDYRYACMICRDMLKFKPSGRQFLNQRLLRRGIDRQIREQVLQEFLDPNEEITHARQAAESFLRRLRKSSRTLALEKQRQRLFSFLARRGFSGDIASAVTNRILEQL